MEWTRFFHAKREDVTGDIVTKQLTEFGITRPTLKPFDEQARSICVKGKTFFCSIRLHEIRIPAVPPVTYSKSFPQIK